MSTACPQCGTTLAPDAKFCRACGAAVRVAPGLPVSGGGSELRCRQCGHLNPPDSSFCRGCGAALAAQAGAAQPRTAAPAGPATPAAPVHAPVERALASGRRSGPSATLIAVISVAVIAAGTGVALAVIAGDESGTAVHKALSGITSTVTEQEAPPSADTSGSAAAQTGEGASTASSQSAVAEGDPYAEVATLQSVLLRHHEDIVAGDFNGAWDLTSARYRREKEDEPGGYSTWVTHQQTLQHYLVPNGLRLSVESWDKRSQVATVRVTGMRWNAPNSPCTHWQGITWMRYENGAWYYEPGYSVSPQRTAQWRARVPELLGYGCA